MAVIVTPAPSPQSSTGSIAGTVPVNLVPSSNANATAVANTAVVETINGVAGQAIRINFLCVSYSAVPTGGLLSIVVNAVTIFSIAIIVGGPTPIPLPDGGLECAVGQNAVITLAAGGAAVIGSVNAGWLFGS